jgi:hypothetical protein
MKKFVLFIVVLLLSPLILLAQNREDSLAIKSASMDYVEGWYEADYERMESSLHPDLVKRVVREHPRSKRPILNHISKTTLVEYTRGGGGKDTPRDKLFYEVAVLDIYNGIATVKGVSANYVDYLHLAKWNDKWLIVNILWDDRK